ncbi:MAG: shikimate kinase [Candidatus Eremiobacterota bacterium]
MTRRNIYLVGFMGTGKTTIGRELARVMGRKFLDVDLELEKRLEMTVNEIFDTHGEEFFRTRERELAREVAAMTNRVVATGGGTIVDPDTFELFNQNGLLICLYTRREDLVGRLQRTDKRPMLRGDVEDRVEKLMEERKRIYDRVKIRIDTTELTPLTAARKIQELLNTRQQILQRLSDQYIELS